MARKTVGIVIPSAPPATTPSVRAVMQANASLATRPELALRSALHRAGRRFRKNLRVQSAGCTVRPDIVFLGPRVAVFVDGCFWHGCPTHGTTPTTNASYWTAKLDRNQQRDEQVNAALTAGGWHVVRVWEHVSVDDARDIVLAALRDNKLTGSGTLLHQLPPSGQDSGPG